MKKTLSVSFIALSGLLSSSAVIAESQQLASPVATADYQLAINKQGIMVWTAPVQNSSLLAFKAQTTISSNLTPIVATIYDDKAVSEWIPNTKNVTILEKNATNTQYKIHFIVDMPFPLSNRDVVANIQYNQQPNGIISIISDGAIDAKKPVTAGVIRIKNYHTEWYLMPKANHKTQVLLSGFIDPAGGLPSWAVNMFVEDQPFKMLKSLKKMVQKPQYQQATMAIVQEQFK